MYRKLTLVTITVLLLSLAFASVTFAQTGTGNTGTQDQNGQGSGPGNAFNSLANGSRSLQPNQQQWYAFQYAGDNSPIQVRLSGSNMQFSVWTQQDINNAAGNFGSSANPVGRSTSNSNFNGDQYWTGSFNAPGTYYVMVENANGGQGGNYTLQITGSGVSFGGQSGNNANGNNNGNASNNTGGSTSTSGTGSSTSGSTSGTAPSTLPQTGGEMASVLPMLIGGIGALSVAAGAMLRRKK